jgi:hypothetical protein
MPDDPNPAPEKDEMLAALRALPSFDAPPETAVRVQRRAHAILTKGRGPLLAREHGMGAVLSRWLVPAVLTSVVFVYLTWAFDAAAKFHN